MSRFHSVLTCFMVACLACNSDSTKKETTEESRVTILEDGRIEVIHPDLVTVLDTAGILEVLAEGFDWSEGPVWVAEHSMLLFSDIPPNTVYAWTEADGIEQFLKPSGYTGSDDREGEPGSNGLHLDEAGNLILCQHGDRRIARYSGSFEDPSPVYETLADKFEGKRFNSPNDAAFHSNGSLFFTDPPYGLEEGVEDTKKEIPFQGVYRLDPDGSVHLMVDSITRPNGIAFSPDESKIYVASSDPEKAIWMVYDVIDNSFTNGRIFYDVTSWVGKEKGLPDGLKVDNTGNLFATGPGGVWIFSPEGIPLGLIRTGEATANCGFNEDKSVLFITADMYLLRLRLR
ncbi:MAG: SMP-30/gluconolactonase/LRE family protein [Saprospiraceae bacterium]|nr:SMP-30/gluconolactonase/LRE family protein [Saprospiraceae bacterium]